MTGLTIINVLARLINFYEILIIIWCIFSWLPRTTGILGDIGNALDAIVGPYVNLFRRIMPPFGGIDFSPMLAIIVLGIVSRFVLNFLARILV